MAECSEIGQERADGDYSREVGLWEITTRFPHARFLTNSKLPTRRELFRVVVPRRKSAIPLQLPLPRDEEES